MKRNEEHAHWTSEKKGVRGCMIPPRNGSGMVSVGMWERRRKGRYVHLRMRLRWGREWKSGGGLVDGEGSWWAESLLMEPGWALMMVQHVHDVMGGCWEEIGKSLELGERSVSETLRYARSRVSFRWQGDSGLSLPEHPGMETTILVSNCYPPIVGY